MYIHVHTDEGFTRFGILWILVTIKILIKAIAMEDIHVESIY